METRGGSETRRDFIYTYVSSRTRAQQKQLIKIVHAVVISEQRRSIKKERKNVAAVCKRK